MKKFKVTTSMSCCGTIKTYIVEARSVWQAETWACDALEAELSVDVTEATEQDIEDYDER